jgi:hypothetical protein
MVREEYEVLRDELFSKAAGVSKVKGQDYTVGSEDVLENFKAVAKRTGLSPEKVLAIYLMKHQDAIANYIRTGGQSESEPIEMRIVDNINYLCLLWGLINENTERKSKGTQTPKMGNADPTTIFSTTPRGGYSLTIDGSSGDRPNNESIGAIAYSFRHRMQESGEGEHLVSDEASRREHRSREDSTSNSEKE